MTICKPGCDALGFGGHDLDCPKHPEQSKASKDVPEWALVRACEITGVPRSDYDSPVFMSVAHRMITCFARYIAAHEPAPVDPLRRFVTEIVEAAVSDIHLSDEAGIEHAIEVAKAILPAAALDALGGE